MIENLAEADAERRAEIAMDVVHIANLGRRKNRERALTAREALLALEFEALLVAVAAGNIANGIGLSEEDRERLALAYTRIDTIVNEAIR